MCTPVGGGDGFAVEFSYEDAQEPLVTVTQCFDDLLIAPDHVSRRPSDT